MMLLAHEELDQKAGVTFNIEVELGNNPLMLRVAKISLVNVMKFFRLKHNWQNI